MTEIQKAAIASAEAKMAPAMAVLRERNRVLRAMCVRVIHRLELHDLVRLADLIENLDDDDFRQVAAFAEALAEWPKDGSSSGDATKAGEAAEDQAGAAAG